MAYVDDTPLGMDNNIVPQRNVYPASGGGTLATAASASSPDQFVSGPVMNADGSPASSVSTPAMADTSVGGHPVTWWLGIALLVGGIMFLARKTGQASEFSNIRASVYNVTLITFVAILGITVMKIFAVKVKGVPGLGGFSSVVIAA